MIPNVAKNSILAIWFILFIFFFCPMSLLAKNNIGGNVAVEVDSKNRSKTKVGVTAKIKFKSKRLFRMKAHIDVEGSAVDKDVHFEDVYIDYKFSKKWNASFGYSKKILGMEYEIGRQRRLTIHRSPIYKKMEALGLVGRQITLRFNYQLGKKKSGTNISAAVGGDNGRDINAALSLQTKYKHWGYGGWALLEMHRIDGEYIPVFAEALALFYQKQQGQIALELHHGVDAQGTELEKRYGEERTVYFLGPKLNFVMNFILGKTLTLSPLFRTSLVMHDLKNPNENTVEFLIGTKLRWNDLVISFNAEMYGIKNIHQQNRRDFNRKSYYGEVIYFF